ncbi:MAG: Xaa-Pro peptidase family protein [Gammaproteobacteria bacterium]|jgi:Xaa-Pro aminopeptidase|nr:Xaa-Pro peptidase family protein [Gammaproteobacteria bacterium]
MRGFTTSEFAQRTARAQTLMAQHQLSAILLTTEADVRYFTGYLTRFWESPCRPWYLIVPAQGKPVAVIPSIGGTLMRKSWIDDVRTWRAPNMEDDGIDLLSEALREIAPDGRIATPSGMQSQLRMPQDNLHSLLAKLGIPKLLSDANIVRNLRMVKSTAEIAKVRHACQIAARAFERMGEIAQVGIPQSQVFRQFQMLCLDEGADWVPYLAGGVGPMGYDDVISPASDTPLKDGDILMLDTGLVFDGYFCDYDRNYALTHAAPQAQAAWHQLMEATQAGIEAGRPGALASDVFKAMDMVLTGGKGIGDTGRLGHGLGMQLTELPSLIAADHTVLQAGMVLTLEPSVIIEGGGVIVHEDNYVVGTHGLEPLSPLPPADLPVL